MMMMVLLIMVIIIRQMVDLVIATVMMMMMMVMIMLMMKMVMMMVTKTMKMTMMMNMVMVVEERREGIRYYFQQLRSYRDEIETRNREEIPYSSRIVPGDLSVGSFSCRRTIDSPPQRRTFI